MKSLFILILSVALLQCSTKINEPEPEKEYQRFQIESGNLVRTFLVQVPESIHENDTLPILIAYHGANGSSESFLHYSGFNDFYNDMNFIIVYPDPYGPVWADGVVNIGQIDDVQFTQDLIKKISEEFSIKYNGIFAAGVSIGGLFVHKLGIDLKYQITAYATVASSMAKIIADQIKEPTNLPVLMIHGTEDQAFKWEGYKDDYLAAYLSQNELVDLMLFNNNCSRSSIKTTNMQDVLVDNKFVIKEAYSNENGKILVEYYRIKNGGHEWMAGDINTAKTILDFFQRFIN